MRSAGADDPLYGARRDLRRGLHTHTVRSWARIELAFTNGDPSGQLLWAFQVSHELQRLYAHARDQRAAAHRLHRILVRCADSPASELHRLARTLDTWRSELLAYWTATGRCGVSNDPTEATNCLIKKVTRSGHGFRNFQNYRLLLNVGLDWRNLPLAGCARHPDLKTPTTLGGEESENAGLGRRRHHRSAEDL